MWRAAAGGGLLTVFTAAIKMWLIEAHFPLAVEGFLIGTDYAVSFVLLQLFGFALATKQPSMTAATLAGIIRENRGVKRLSQISEFAADISRTQLAAAFSNVIVVCLGAWAFEKLWQRMFQGHVLAAESAHHVTTTLHPFTSGTAIFAAFYRGAAMAGGGDWRVVRELRGVSQGAGGGRATSLWVEGGGEEDEARGGLAGVQSGELEHKHRAGLSAGVFAGVSRGSSGFPSMCGM